MLFIPKKLKYSTQRNKLHYQVLTGKNINIFKANIHLKYLTCFHINLLN